MHHVAVNYVGLEFEDDASKFRVGQKKSRGRFFHAQAYEFNLIGNQEIRGRSRQIAYSYLMLQLHKARRKVNNLPFGSADAEASDHEENFH